MVVATRADTLFDPAVPVAGGDQSANLSLSLSARQGLSRDLSAGEIGCSIPCRDRHGRTAVACVEASWSLQRA